MTSGSYYNSSYGRPKKVHSADEEELNLNANRRDLETDRHEPTRNKQLYSNEDDDDGYPNFSERKSRGGSYNLYSDRDDENNEIMLKERAHAKQNHKDGMNIKFDIVHKEPYQDNNNSIYRLKQNGSPIGRNGRQNDLDQNGSPIGRNGRQYDLDQNYIKSTILDKSIDPAYRKPSYSVVVVLLASYPLVKKDAEDWKHCEDALNKYIKIWQNKMGDRQDLTKPKKNDVAYQMNFFPDSVTLIDLQSKALVRRYTLNKILVHGYSKKKNDKLFAYIHQEQDHFTYWLFHTFASAQIVSEEFKKCCNEGKVGLQIIKKNANAGAEFPSNQSRTIDTRYTGDQELSRYENNRSRQNIYNSESKKYSKNNSNSYANHDYALNNLRTIDTRYTSDQELSRYENNRSRQNIYNSEAIYRKQEEESRQPRLSLRPIREDSRRAAGATSYGPNYSPDFSPTNEYSYEGQYGSPRNAPKYRNNGYEQNSYMRAYDTPRYEERVYSLNRKTAPTITHDAQKYNGKRESTYRTQSDSRTIKSRNGTISGEYDDEFRLKSFASEAITTITCKYVGFLTVNRVTGFENANKIAEKVISSLPQTKWLNVRVEITSTKIRVERTNNEPIFGSKISNLNYMGIFYSDKRFGVVSALRTDGHSMCHVFYCEPNCQQLLKILNLAYQYQNDESNFARKPIVYP